MAERQGAGAAQGCVQVWGAVRVRGAVQVRGPAQVWGAGVGAGAAQGRLCLPGVRARGTPLQSVPRTLTGAPARARRCPGPRRCGGTPEKGEGADAPSRTKKGTAQAKRQSLPPVDGACPCPGRYLPR